jgi:hypothetical protein
MNSQITLRRQRAVGIKAIIAAGLLLGCNASSFADQRADALDKTIPAAMQRAAIPGAIVGIWQDGREPYVPHIRRGGHWFTGPPRGETHEVHKRHRHHHQPDP